LRGCDGARSPAKLVAVFGRGREAGRSQGIVADKHAQAPVQQSGAGAGQQHGTYHGVGTTISADADATGRWSLWSRSLAHVFAIGCRLRGGFPGARAAIVLTDCS
jgi:hypothetical protein